MRSGTVPLLVLDRAIEPAVHGAVIEAAGGMLIR